MFGLTPFNRRNNSLSGRNDFMDLRNVFEEFFTDTAFPTFFTEGPGIRADIRESEKEYVIEAEIPGVKKEDIKLDLRDEVLTIAVEHREEVSEERDNFIRKERKFGSFSRSFAVNNIKREGVTAKYEDGILSIVLPKEEDGKVNRRQIDIQ